MRDDLAPQFELNDVGNVRAKFPLRLRIADCGLRIADCGLRIADCGLRIADCGRDTAT